MLRESGKVVATTRRFLRKELYGRQASAAAAAAAVAPSDALKTTLSGAGPSHMGPLTSVDALPGRKWGWPLLTMAMIGCGLSSVTASFAHTEHAPEENTDAMTVTASEEDKNVAKAKDEDTPANLVEMEKTLEEIRTHLRKRKTCGRSRFLVSTAAVRGDRSHMEDTSFISSCKRFAAVFDGHGGADVSAHLRAVLFPKLLSRELDQLDRMAFKADSQKHTLIENTLRQAFEKIDADVLARDAWRYQGSTAVGVLLFDDTIYCFNVGDSRAVLSRAGEAVDLSRDHKPNDPMERARVEALGGTVRWYGYVDAQGEPIEEFGAYRVNGNLAVARAIGDRDARPYVCGECEVKSFARDYDKDEFIVIASDGLWDVFTSEEVVMFVHDVLTGELGGRESWRSGGHVDTRVPIFEWSHQYRSDTSMIKAAQLRRKTQIANYLVQEALFRGTSDNVSVIVVWLR